MGDFNKLHGGQDDNSKRPLKVSEASTQKASEAAQTLSNENRYSNHKGYTELFEKYGKDEKYSIFFSKLKIEGNDVIVDHKKFSFLTAEHNGKDILSSTHIDRLGNSPEKHGIKDLTYMTGDAAINEAKKQNKKLFKTEDEIYTFINQFPGESINDKILSFITLSGIQKSGKWDPELKMWDDLGSKGYGVLSKVNGDGMVYGIQSDNGYYLGRSNQAYPLPTIAFEDC